MNCLEQYSHGVHGEVDCLVAAQKQATDGKPEDIELAILRYELVNFSSRANLDKVEGRVSRICEKYEIAKHIPWDQVWEDVRIRVIEWFRRGEPVIESWTNADVEKPKYLVWPFIPLNQTTIFFAEPESFKSGFGLLFAGLVGACWTDHPKLGFRTNIPSRGGSSLVLDNETTHATALWQMKRICQGFRKGGYTGEFPLNYRRVNRPIADDVEQIKRHMASLHTNFLVIDSLMRAAGGDVLKTETVNALFDAIDYLGCTTLILAHSPKPQPGVPDNRSIYGNAFFQYLPRSVWEIKKVKEVDSDTMDLGFFHVKGNLSKKFRPVGFRLGFIEDGPITIQSIPIETTELKKYMSIPQQIITLLKDGIPRTYQQIAEELEAKEKTVKDKLTYLRVNGKVQNLGHGWTIIQPE